MANGMTLSYVAPNGNDIAANIVPFGRASLAQIMLMLDTAISLMSAEDSEQANPDDELAARLIVRLRDFLRLETEGEVLR